MQPAGWIWPMVLLCLAHQATSKPPEVGHGLLQYLGHLGPSGHGAKGASKG